MVPHMIIHNFNDKHKMTSNMIKQFVDYIKLLLQKKQIIRVAIATGSTLVEFIELLQYTDVPFQRIIIYAVDEYQGIDYRDSKSCCYDLISGLGNAVCKVASLRVFSRKSYIREIERYNRDLEKYGLDICILGVGKDGHIGFCYPPINNMLESYYVSLDLSEAKKKEHVNNGWFLTVDDVPNSVITLSLWGIFQSSIIMLGAVYEDKKDIITKLLYKKGKYQECPVLYLCNHSNFNIYLG